MEDEGAVFKFDKQHLEQLGPGTVQDNAPISNPCSSPSQPWLYPATLPIGGWSRLAVTLTRTTKLKQTNMSCGRSRWRAAHLLGGVIDGNPCTGCEPALQTGVGPVVYGQRRVEPEPETAGAFGVCLLVRRVAICLPEPCRSLRWHQGAAPACPTGELSLTGDVIGKGEV